MGRATPIDQGARGEWCRKMSGVVTRRYAMLPLDGATRQPPTPARPLVPAHIYVYIHVYMPRRRLPTSLDEISSHCVCFSVRRAARAVTQAYDRTLAPSGLRATQLTLLVALARVGTVPFASVAPLKRDGLLTMRRGPDRRVKLVAITTSGRKALARAIPLWERAQRRITTGLGAGHWDSLRREIERITALADINPREGTRP